MSPQMMRLPVNSVAPTAALNEANLYYCDVSTCVWLINENMVRVWQFRGALETIYKVIFASGHAACKKKGSENIVRWRGGHCMRVYSML